MATIFAPSTTMRVLCRMRPLPSKSVLAAMTTRLDLGTGAEACCAMTLPPQVMRVRTERRIAVRDLRTKPRLTPQSQNRAFVGTRFKRSPGIVPTRRLRQHSRIRREAAWGRARAPRRWYGGLLLHAAASRDSQVPGGCARKTRRDAAPCCRASADVWACDHA